MESCMARGLNLSKRASIFSPKKVSYVLSRANSTATPKPSSSPAANASVETLTEPFTWPQYLDIKRSKRTWQTVVTIPCALAGFVGGVLYFANLDADPLKPIMGIDPFFFYGFCTVGCVGAGALIGPTLGGSIWRYTHRRVLAQYDAKESEFYRRIAKNRVDASLQNPTSPVPDYYGERIGSLHQYRQWLRDQAKYRRKALLPEE